MTVSVLIPCLNAGRHIEAAIRSAFAQDPVQVLVADCGSVDGSSELAAELGATVYHVGDIGQVGARNFLAAHADGEWVQWLDADDYLLPGKIDRQLEDSDEVDSTYCDFEIVRSDSRRPRHLHGLSPWYAAMMHSPIQVAAYLTRTEVVRAVPFDPKFDSGGNNAKWAIDLTVAGVEFRHIPIVGCVWRQGWSEQQTTANPDPTIYERLVRSAPEPSRERLMRDFPTGVF